MVAKAVCILATSRIDFWLGHKTVPDDQWVNWDIILGQVVVGWQQQAAGHVLCVQHGGQGLANLTKRHLSLLKFTGDIEDIHVLTALFTQ